MKTLTFTICTLFCFNILFSQNTIDVTDRNITIEARKTEELYFSFAAGDQIIFNVSEKDKKSLTEIEVLEYPYNSKFAIFETGAIENKTLHVAKTAVYRFRFYNDTRSNRKCSVKIQRIPASEEAQAFNTTVVWHTQYDTSYYTVQEQYLKNQEHVLQEIIPLTAAHVNSSNILFPETNSRIVFPVKLPEHTIEWYYRVSFSHDTIEEIKNFPNLVGELNMLMEQTGGIEFGPYHLAQAPGEAYCDVYIMDSVNAVRFQAREDYKYLSIGSSKHIRSGITKVYGNSSMPLYLGINNADSGNLVNILIECVAIISTEEKDVRVVEKMNVASRVVPALNIDDNISWIR